MRLYHGSDMEIVAVDLSCSQVNKDFGQVILAQSDTAVGNKAMLNQECCNRLCRLPEQELGVVLGFAYDWELNNFELLLNTNYQ